MTGGFDPARYTPAPLQTEGVIRFTSSPDAVFARITNHAAMTDWVPLLKTVHVSHPKPLPPGESMVGTTRILTLRGAVTLRERVVYWNPPRCYAYTTEGKRRPTRNYWCVSKIARHFRVPSVDDDAGGCFGHVGRAT